MSSACALFQAPFYFLRHGETEINRLGLVSGQSDVELNEAGWRQARAAAQWLSGRGIGSIYSSPLKRARDTAGCIATMLGLEIAIVPELAERNWGEFEGKPRELRVREETPPGGEGSAIFASRTLAGLASIPADPLPLVVAHSGTFRVLCEALGIQQLEKAIDNSVPLHFMPPSANAARWTMIRVTAGRIS